MRKLAQYVLGSLIVLGSLFSGTAAAACLNGNGGGTGLCTATSGDAGQTLIVASTTPFLTYRFGAAGGSLTSTYVGFGSGSNSLTGSPNFIYNSSTQAAQLNTLSSLDGTTFINLNRDGNGDIQIEPNNASGTYIYQSSGGNFASLDTSLLSASRNYKFPDASGTLLLQSSTAIVTASSVQASIIDTGGQVFNVKAYGAKCDGVTDDTSALQNVLNISVGGIMLFPSNVTCKISSTLTFRSGNNIRGNSSTIRLANGSNSDIFDSVLTGIQNASIVGMTLDGNGANQTNGSALVLITGNSKILQNVLVANNTIENCWQHCVFFTGASTTAYQNYVQNNYIYNHGVGTVGFGIYEDYSPFMLISGNTICKSNGDDGIEIGHLGAAIVENNYLCDGPIQFPFGSNSIIKSNILALGNIQNDANEADYVTITDNQVLSSTPATNFAGITAFGKGDIITNNYVRVLGQSGIRIDNGSFAMMANNTIDGESSSTTSNCIYVENSSNTSIFGNDITNCTRGVEVDNDYNLISYNNITNASSGVDFADSSVSGHVMVGNQVFFNSIVGAQTPYNLHNQTNGGTVINASGTTISVLSNLSSTIATWLGGPTTLASTTNALTMTNGNGLISGYSATSCAAGTAFTGLSATGTPTCTSFGSLTGNGTSTWVPFYNSATGLSSNASFTFNSSTGVFAAPTGTFSGKVTITNTGLPQLSIVYTGNGACGLEQTINGFLVITGCSTGINEALPGSRFSVGGNESIGAATFSETAAPTNGLLVQGAANFGTTSTLASVTIAPSSTATTTLSITGLPQFLGSSTVVTPSIGGAIVSGGCDSATTSIDTSVTSSTAAFITTPTGNPGTTLGGTWAYSYLLSSGVIQTNVCSNVSVTPNSLTYIIKIIK